MFTPTRGYQIIVKSPLFVCMYVFFFLFGLHAALRNLQSKLRESPACNCLSETVGLSVIFCNSFLHVYFILRNHLVSKWKTLFEFSIDKQHWKHSICDKSLLNFDVLKIFFLPFWRCRSYRNWQPFNSLFSPFCLNSPVRLLILANDH